MARTAVKADIPRKQDSNSLEFGVTKNIFPDFIGAEGFQDRQPQRENGSVIRFAPMRSWLFFQGCFCLDCQGIWVTHADSDRGIRYVGKGLVVSCEISCMRIISIAVPENFLRSKGCSQFP